MFTVKRIISYLRKYVARVLHHIIVSAGEPLSTHLLQELLQLLKSQTNVSKTDCSKKVTPLTPPGLVSHNPLVTAVGELSSKYLDASVIESKLRVLQFIHMDVHLLPN